MSKRKRLRRTKNPKGNVNRGKNPIESEAPLTFDLSKKDWLKCVSVDGFTNKLKDEEMFSEKILEVFRVIIPILHEHGVKIIKSGGTGSWKHCHPIRNDQLDLANKVIDEIHGDFTKDIGYGSKLWQFGITGGIRLIAIHNYKDNYLTPLFIDYHHQIYPDVNYNQLNIESYPFCPIEKFN